MGFSEMYQQAAEVIQKAKVLVITAGAGMGVDSGLPDFRGERGFWNAYPMYENLGVSFADVANPAGFYRDPAFGWGFYGHRTNLYRGTKPHAGFAILLDWCERFGIDCFVVTSNVDGQFQKAGFDGDKILEVHGSIHWLQCTKPCSEVIWENIETIPIDHVTMRALHIPKCIRCGVTARPNILMFGDWSWLSERTASQEQNYDDFITRYREVQMAVIELGAGTAIPTIRHTSERLGRHQGVSVIRVNPREGDIAPPHISLPCGALDALRGIAAALPRLP
jgi:NAD-dependent SIR2 family protein deacetylase